MTETLAAVRGIENLSPGGRRATVDVAKSLGINPDWLVKVMGFETDGTFSPKVKNRFSGATGMIQFMPSTAGLLGYTISQLENMSQEEQIRGPVFKYLSPYKGRMRSLDDVYLAVFFPSAIGQSDSYIVGKKDGTSREQAIYKQNSGFDRSGSGVIRKGDIVASIRGIPTARVEVPGSDFFRIALYFSLFGLTTFYIVNWGTRGKAGRTVKREFHVTNPTAVKLLS